MNVRPSRSARRLPAAKKTRLHRILSCHGLGNTEKFCSDYATGVSFGRTRCRRAHGESSRFAAGLTLSRDPRGRPEHA